MHVHCICYLCGALQSVVTRRKIDITTWDKDQSLTLRITRLFMLIACALVMTRIYVYIDTVKIRIAVMH